MPPESPSVHRKRVLEPYILARIERENTERGRGYPAALARAIDVSRPHAHNMLAGKAGVGEDRVPLFAKMWGMTLEQLTTAAEAWAAGPGAEQDTSPAARLARLIDQELAARAQKGETFTAEQIRRVHSLAAYGGRITRADVRQALDRKDDDYPPAGIEAELEQEHSRARGKRRRGV